MNRIFSESEKKIDYYFYIITEIRKNKQTLRSSSYLHFLYIADGKIVRKSQTNWWFKLYLKV